MGHILLHYVLPLIVTGLAIPVAVWLIKRGASAPDRDIRALRKQLEDKFAHARDLIEDVKERLENLEEDVSCLRNQMGETLRTADLDRLEHSIGRDMEILRSKIVEIRTLTQDAIQDMRKSLRYFLLYIREK